MLKIVAASANACEMFTHIALEVRGNTLLRHQRLGRLEHGYGIRNGVGRGLPDHSGLKVGQNGLCVLGDIRSGCVRGGVACQEIGLHREANRSSSVWVGRTRGSVACALLRTVEYKTRSEICPVDL